MKQLIIALAVVFAACSTHTTNSEPAVVAPKATEVQGEETLRPDEFDAPAAISVAEAAKAAGEAPVDGALYACPMHPNVTSATPGTCSICGMTLTKRKVQP